MQNFFWNIFPRSMKFLEEKSFWYALLSYTVFTHFKATFGGVQVQKRNCHIGCHESDIMPIEVRTKRSSMVNSQIIYQRSLWMNPLYTRWRDYTFWGPWNLLMSNVRNLLSQTSLSHKNCQEKVMIVAVQ